MGLRLSLFAKSMTVPVAVALLVGVLSCNKSQSDGPPKIKIGFLVKQPEQAWFRLEQQFAKQAADKDGFEVIPMSVQEGEKVLTAIDNLAANGAGGFVICTPDTKLGPAIKKAADRYNMKLLSVDDQFVGPDGKPMEEVHHLGISARNIGHLVGKSLYDEMKKRAWKPEETATCVVTFDQLPTAKERTEGATEALVEAGFAKDRIFTTPQKTNDVTGAFDATNTLLTQHGDVKHWLVCGLNDEAVQGAIRAMEGRNLTAVDTIGIGINGTDLTEFKKDKPTGFFGSVLLSAKRHGYETADMMFKWIKDGQEPPKATYTTGVLITRDNYQQVLKEQGVTP